MDDDQWLSGGSQRQRPAGGNSGPNPGQRPGPSRPSTSGPLNGRASGGLNNSTIGNSRPVPRSQGYGRDDAGWDSSPRRGQAGGSSARSGSLGTNSRYLGGSGNQSGRGGRDDDGGQWQGGSSRTSRSLNQPQGRPSSPVQGGRGGQTGQWNNSQRGGWDDEEDDPRGARRPQGRAPSGQVGQGARGAQGRPGGPQKVRGNVTVRGNWVIENDAKGGAPPTSNPLRRRLLMLLLAIVVVVGGAMVLVPNLRARMQCYFPGANCNTANAQTGTTSQGTLVIQVNVPSATVKIDDKEQTTQAGETAPFSSVTFIDLASGQHTLTIHADKYTDFSGPLTWPAESSTLTAWLAPDPDTLTAMGTQFGTPALQPDAGVARDHYSPTQIANGDITVSVSYTIGGLDSAPFTDQAVPGDDTENSPFQPAPLTLTPVFTFKDADGNTLATTDFPALPATQFGVSVLPTVDEQGNPQLSAQSVIVNAADGKAIKTSFTGPAASDYALLYALASAFPTAPDTLNLTCIGAVDNQKFNPEDGLFIVDTQDDTEHAHFFYRWGILWATNDFAQQLAPDAPVAQAGTNEFENANTARANGSCGG